MTDYRKILDEASSLLPTKNEAVHLDEGKPQIALVPPELLFSVAEVLTQSLSKYDARNWEQGMAWSKIFNSLNRHLWKWQAGEDRDPHSGLSHLAHVCANAAFLIAYIQRGIGTDDRPRISPKKV